LFILQDQKGFLWFGTEDGLNKYDGYNFTILRHDPHQPNSLSYNEIRAMYFKIKREMFTALCFAAIDIKTKELAFTNGGLIEPLLKRGATAVYLEAASCKHPLGVTKDDFYEKRKLPLQSGDVLVFVTDGVTEEQNSAGEMYGELALKTLLEQMDSAHATAAAIKTKIIAEVKRFSGATQQDDDMTVIVVKIL
jgi:sigma-B regulation protein RsbU (phosphoserine phosphatase)